MRNVQAYATNNFAIAMNGGNVSADTAGVVPAVTGLRLGSLSYNNAASQFMGYARRFTYYPKRLPDAQIQGMSRV